MTDEPIRYRGKPIDDMTIDELRAALIACARNEQDTARMRQERIRLIASLDIAAQRRSLVCRALTRVGLL